MATNIELKISTLSGQVVNCHMEREATGLDVKQIVSNTLGIPCEQQVLFCDDVEFSNHDSLVDHEGVVQLQVVFLRPEALIGVMSWAICGFDMGRGSWSVITGRPTPNEWCTACYLNEFQKLYVIGGRKAPERIEILDIVTGEWTIGPNLCVPRAYAKSAIFQNHIVVSGGKTSTVDLAHCDASGYISAVEALDLSQPDAQWKLIAPMRCCRAAHGMHVVKGQLVALGGLNENQTGLEFPTEVEALDNLSGTWRVFSRFCNPRDPDSGMNFFGSTVWHDELVVAGGKALKYVELAIVGNKLVCTGGVDSQGKHGGGIYMLEGKKGSWQLVGDGRRDLTAELGPLGCFAAIGIPVHPDSPLFANLERGPRFL
eukprot:gnl/MRDRNA2_/MRDRNA2_66366_c0_seq1.p1 gnl/MRDRNA2_/MRDRNA2_66366_c0~~gnl/MRDRNA2_/MRDRNA2_66366_c0_seq1.p1  ORF type:complete len:371 (+),score=51.23 gnl/MRDRNA2_/MRDRNA2_66366_c0_seq1:79-1191(+)